MRLFSRRKLNNTAAGVLPPPVAGPTTIHNHAPNPLWEAVSRVVAIFLAAAGVWGALWFLFWQMGSLHPSEDAALLVLYGTLIPVGLWFLSWLLTPYFESDQSYKLEMAREMTRREEVRLLAAQTTINPGRMNDTDYDFARVVLAVMMRAYEWLEREQRTAFPARWRPWSLSSSRDTAEQIGVKLTQAQANAVSVWLHEHGVITSPDGGQITKKYPDLSSVRVMLDNEFGKPIVVNPPALRSNRGYVPIKN